MQEEEGSSLDTQEERCRAYAAERGWQVVGVYRETHTGSELWERPQLTTLRETVRDGAVDVLLAYALDRLSRKQTHVAIIAEDCERTGAQLAFVTEDFEKSAVGTALMEIREKRLYRTDGWDTFEEYCQERWGWTRGRAYQLMDAATVALELSTTVDILPPRTERQARELTPLRDDPNAMREVWREVREERGEDGKYRLMPFSASSGQAHPDTPKSLVIPERGDKRSACSTSSGIQPVVSPQSE